MTLHTQIGNSCLTKYNKMPLPIWCLNFAEKGEDVSYNFRIFTHDRCFNSKCLFSFSSDTCALLDTTQRLYLHGKEHKNDYDRHNENVVEHF